jgi:DNA-directed RNA polymerase specialized sigma24 family protein
MIVSTVHVQNCKSRARQRDARHERSEAAAMEPDRSLLAAALGRLPEALRNAIILQQWHGRSLAEFAEAMGRTRDGVAGLIRRGMRQLRAEVQGLGE